MSRSFSNGLETFDPKGGASADAFLIRDEQVQFSVHRMSRRDMPPEGRFIEPPLILNPRPLQGSPSTS